MLCMPPAPPPSLTPPAPSLDPPPRPSPAKVRRAALYGALQEVEGEMQFATAKTSRDVDELQV